MVKSSINPENAIQPENQKEIPDFVSFSSQLMAAIRAIETERSDCLYTDTFAADLAGAKALEMVKEKAKLITNDVIDRLVIRTRFFDEFLMTAVSEVRQVVVLASGMDARAFRLNWPEGTSFYELEKPEVLAKKELILKQVSPKCNRQAIAADLTQPWVDLLIQQGYQVEQPSVWLLEGLLMYLTESEVYNLLKTIWDITASGSYLGADVLSPAALQSEDSPAKYWRSGFDYPEELFNSIGWEAQVFQLGEEGASFGRLTQQPLPRETLNIARSFLIKAHKNK